MPILEITGPGRVVETAPRRALEASAAEIATATEVPTAEVTPISSAPVAPPPELSAGSVDVDVVVVECFEDEQRGEPVGPKKPPRASASLCS